MGLDWFGIGHKASHVSGVRLERAIVSIGCENVARSPAWCHRSGRSCVRFVLLPYSLAVRKTRFVCHSVLVESVSRGLTLRLESPSEMPSWKA